MIKKIQSNQSRTCLNPTESLSGPVKSWLNPCKSSKNLFRFWVNPSTTQSNSTKTYLFRTNKSLMKANYTWINLFKSIWQLFTRFPLQLHACLIVNLVSTVLSVISVIIYSVDIERNPETPCIPQSYENCDDKHYATVRNQSQLNL